MSNFNWFRPIFIGIESTSNPYEDIKELDKNSLSLGMDLSDPCHPYHYTIAPTHNNSPLYKEVPLKTAAIVEQPKPMIDEEYINEFIDYSTKIVDIKSKQLRPLTKAEFDFAVKLLYNDGKVDTEAWHGESDDLMEKQLTALGYDVSIISDSERWYS